MNDEDPERLADQRDREADELARRSEKLGQEVEAVRQDWKQKRASEGVPGAVPESREEQEGGDHEEEPA